MFAVAITNTGVVFSCSQVMKLPKTRAAVPASVVNTAPASPTPTTIPTLRASASTREGDVRRSNTSARATTRTIGYFPSP